jgi:hypothetical protein
MLLKTNDKGTRSVVLTIGESKAPAKLLAANLLPRNLHAVTKIQTEVNDLIDTAQKLTREIQILEKQFKVELADEKISVGTANQTKDLIEAKEAERKATNGKTQGIIDKVETWCLETIVEIDLVKPVEGLSDADLEELAELEAKGELSNDDKRVEKVKFNREVLRELMEDPRGEGLISFVPLTLAKIIVESTQVGEARGSN